MIAIRIACRRGGGRCEEWKVATLKTIVEIVEVVIGRWWINFDVAVGVAEIIAATNDDGAETGRGVAGDGNGGLEEMLVSEKAIRLVDHRTDRDAVTGD